ncbi:MAG: magnesium or manganese-dependent protein phosphatase [Solirubrobacterales bacterium]|nr:magnesium or manganese-dependent protein phosphatase [Solirubrobacterales bacterium]
MSSGDRQSTRGVALPLLQLDSAEIAALLHAFSDYLWRAHPDGSLMTDMPAWRQITGQSPEDLLGSGWLEGVHPDDRQLVITAWQAAVETVSGYDVEYRITGSGGERWYHARAAPVLDAVGQVQRWIGTVADITDRHDAVAARDRLRGDLDQQQVLLERVLAEAPTAIAILWGPDHEYRYFNARYLDLVPARELQPGMTVLCAFPEAKDVIPVLDAVRAGDPFPFDELKVPFDGPGSYAGHRYYKGTYAPLLQDGSPGGVLTVATEVTREVRMREDLTERLRHERHAAERLQRALLPDHAPDIDGLDIALAYVPAEDDVGVGGDWYDVLNIGDGRVLLVIGDVCGRGLDAATHMSQMRAVLRAYAFADSSPGAVLSRCAEYAERVGLADIITIGVGLLDRNTGELRWASAGHPPPLLLGSEGRSRYAEQTGGPPIGLGPLAYDEIADHVEDDGAIVLYTDGAIEDRRRHIDHGLDGLKAAAPSPGQGAGAVRDALLAHLQQAGAVSDDVALLIVRRT